MALAHKQEYGDLKKLAEENDWNYTTLRQCKSVANQYKDKMYERSYNLSYDHYQIAAPLEDRLEWLKKAADNNWSTSDLRQVFSRIFAIRKN